MMTFGDMSELSCGLLLAYFMLQLILVMISLIIVVSIGSKFFSFFLNIVLLISGFVFVCMAVLTIQGKEKGEFLWFRRIPVAVIFVYIIVFACICAADLWYLLRWKNSHITMHSIKESLDLMPTGLCYSLPGGMPVLVNQKMPELSVLLTGQEVLNADHFWEILQEKADTEIVLELPDGTFCSFTRKRLSFQNKDIYELIASNITTQYVLNKRLKNDNLRLKQMNERLRKYNQNVEEATREKEILAAKVRIHDQIGYLLLAAKRVLTMDSDAQARKNLLRLWQQDTTLLVHNPQENAASDSLSDLENAACSLGIRICYQGSLPPDGSRACELLPLVVHECLTNAFSHAQATELIVSLGETGEDYTIKCCNDGEIPDKPLVEGGGLSNLRKHIENGGGTMMVSCEPVFVLSIILPKGSDDDGQKI